MGYFSEDADTDRKCSGCDRRSYSCSCRHNLPAVDPAKDPIVTAPMAKPALFPAVKFDGTPLNPSEYDPDIDFIFPEPMVKAPGATCVGSMVRETHVVGTAKVTVYVWHLEPRRFTTRTGIGVDVDVAKLVTAQRLYVPDVDWRKNIHPVVLITTQEKAYVLVVDGHLLGPMSKSDALRAILS